MCPCPVGENPTLQNNRNRVTFNERRDWKHTLVASLKINQLRFYSSTAVKNLNDRLNPWFVTGFVDGEGCYKISIAKDEAYKTGWRASMDFSISLHVKDRAVLEKIKNFLGVGRISKHGAESVQLRVQSITEIEKIIEHFGNFPLKTQKYADYELWKKAYGLILKKEHLTPDGIRQLVNLRASINKGLPSKLES